MSLPPDPHDDDLTEQVSSEATPAPPPPPPPPPPPAGGDWPGPAGAAVPAGVAATAPPSLAATAPAPVAPPPPSSAVGDPPPADPASSGGRSRILLAVGAAVAVIAVVGGVLVVTGGDDSVETSEGADDEPDADGQDVPDAGSEVGTTDIPDTPEAVVAAFFDAVEAGDCEAIVEFVVPETFTSVGDSPEQAIADCEADPEGRADVAELDVLDVSLVSETGDEAVVSVTAIVDGETGTRELETQRVDGTWLISSLG